MFLGGLHIPKNISQQQFIQNLEDKQSELWKIENGELGLRKCTLSETSLKYPASQQLFVFLQEWNMGQRASDTRGITFEDVVVPKEVSYTFVYFSL